jgi:hypothetical protein
LPECGSAAKPLPTSRPAPIKREIRTAGRISLKFLLRATDRQSMVHHRMTFNPDTRPPLHGDDLARETRR